MNDRRFTCCDCGTVSPDTAEDGSTLISSKFGWRISRRIDATGTPVVDARCPDCYDRYRMSRVALAKQ
jgi:hypothetical protein